MPKLIDETGNRYNRLVVVKYVGKKYYKTGPKRMWLCQCDCGNTLLTPIPPLKNGRTKSCGCLNAENRPFNFRKHGMSNSRVFHIWANMVNRCTNSNLPRYKDYGGRGINICDEWLGKDGASNFINWALRNGYSDKLTLDRIDNSKGYSPDNCRWITIKLQQRNKRTNRLLEFDGETHCIAEWADILGISAGSIKTRLYRGWSVERALTTPILHQEKKGEIANGK